jgi:cell division transport system ATP-binding protein
LIGKTGSGKSSLFKSFYGELPIHSGLANVCGFDLVNLKKSEIPFLRRKLGIIFQDFRLLNDRSVLENLNFVLRATGWESKSSMEKRTIEVLEEVGLVGLENKLPHQLSGGEQQRLVIARALLNIPPLIIADEPTGNLDPETSIEIMNLLIRINREYNTAILMATHDYQLIERFPMRILNCVNNTVVSEKGIIMK